MRTMPLAIHGRLGFSISAPKVVVLALVATLALCLFSLKVSAAEVWIAYSSKRQSQIGVWTAGSGKTFLIITATITVSGYSDFDTNPFYFTLQGDSTSYQHSIATYALPDHFKSEVVPDGSTRTGPLAFEIPQTAAVFALKYDRPFKSYNVRYSQRGRCLIATAAYQSELARQVEALRRVRDIHVMTTLAGSRFMQIFDRFYYSFSPQVAEIVSSNRLFVDTTRIVLDPLISILTLVSGETEIEVIASGIAISTMIGVTYFTIPFVGLDVLFRERRLRRKASRQTCRRIYSRDHRPRRPPRGSGSEP